MYRGKLWWVKVLICGHGLSNIFAVGTNYTVQVEKLFVV